MAEPLGKLHFLFDRDYGPRDRLIPRWLFLRALGLVYFSAFLALAFQILGMSGSGGILPAAHYLQLLQQIGNQRFWVAPTVLWFGASDHALLALVWAGLLASALVTFNILPKPALILCWICFLSWIAVSQDFGSYQSDGMLLEAGLLAILIAPTGIRPRWGGDSLASRAAFFLLLWEWFRIYFESGVVKLASGDPTWRNLTAMYEYYANGPLPTWIGWYLQHLPFAFHKATAGLTLVMELLLVFLAFLPRPWRLACFVLVTVWQIGVIATANYAFLNYLVLILGFLLLDDRALLRFVPTRYRSGLTPDTDITLLHEPDVQPPAITLSSRPERRAGKRPAFAPASASQGDEQGAPGLASETWEPEPPQSTSAPYVNRGLRHHPRDLVRALRIALTTVLLSTIAYATTVPLIGMFLPKLPLPTSPMAVLEPFRVANTYGLFANMTPHRYEIEFQGSDDNATWTPYTFRFKPQDPAARPRIYAPYQPRFDWNLWFASLTTWDQAPIVPRTEIRLLEGSPKSRQTLSLFRTNPFPNHPPKYIRAILYQYWFSTPDQKRTQGLWWTRKYLGTYAPTLTLTPDGKAAAVAVPDLNGPPQ